MIMKKKLFAFCMTAFLLISFTTSTFATTVTLPDGGSTKNTGADKVLGRTSGGEDGYANMVCTLVAKQGRGYIYDSATATIDADIKTIKSAYTNMIIYYASTSGEETRKNEGRPSSNSTPFSLSVNSLSLYATYAVSGHSVNFERRGSWACGMKVKFE